ncbi:hypothetical protein O0L34_g11995 [Tuta absoluta]|nr:hypothetical protein O0L34_g11995 [Tuta absoluta]
MKRIMTNSNATPIRYHNGSTFMCSFCSEQFPNPAALKLHTTPSHIKRYFNRFMDKIISAKYYVKMDITYLQCSICTQDAANIEQLIEHLNEAHLASSKILPEISKLIFPFKFPNHEFKCCICSNVFDNFKTLTQHMHVHYSNFFCSYCAAGFITKTCLYVHERSHLAGPFKCTLCDQEFNTEVKKKRHEAIAHDTKYIKNRNICRICNTRFSDYHKKYRHMVIDHGMKSLAHKCKSCDKDFATKCAMLAHVKRFHLMLKPHKCTMCEMAFFSVAELTKHMNKHTGLMPKRFKCELCPKAFIRMYTLKEHMRSHLNDRRFKCDVCGQAFVQRCSLKSHMMNKHDALFNSSSASYHPTPSPC